MNDWGVTSTASKRDTIQTQGHDQENRQGNKDKQGPKAGNNKTQKHKGTNDKTIKDCKEDYKTKTYHELTKTQNLWSKPQGG